MNLLLIDRENKPKNIQNTDYRGLPRLFLFFF